MTDKELQKIYSAYYPYDLEMGYVVRETIEKVGVLKTIDFNESETHSLRLGIEGMYDLEHEWMFKPFLYDVSMINKEILYNGEVIIPTEDLEIGDYDLLYDVSFLPFEVVQQLLKWKINIFNLPKERYIDYGHKIFP